MPIIGLIIWVYLPRYAPFLGIIVVPAVVAYINNLTNKTIKDFFSTKSLLTISKPIKKIDNRVLSKVRNLKIEDFTPGELLACYNSFINKLWKRKNFQITSVLNYINSKEFNLILNPQADFTIKIDQSLSSIELRNHNEKTVQIDNPRLMWECSCNGDIRKNKRHCPIHKNFLNLKEAKAFSGDFGSGVVLIEYDNIKVFWKQEKDLWPPSIDSFNLINDLRTAGYHEKELTSVIDIGAGTGLLGIWLAKNNKNIKELYFTDWLLLPIIFSIVNVLYNELKTISKYYLGLNLSWYLNKNPGKKYDLIVCNPPYLPELGFKKIGKQSTVAGTQLLKAVIKYGLEIGKEVIISFSDIVLPEAKKSAEEEKVELEEIGIPHLVPFRVTTALNQKGYMEKLFRERKGIKKKEDSVFKYWHTVRTYTVKKVYQKTTKNNSQNKV